MFLDSHPFPNILHVRIGLHLEAGDKARVHLRGRQPGWAEKTETHQVSEIETREEDTAACLTPEALEGHPPFQERFEHFSTISGVTPISVAFSEVYVLARPTHG